MQFPDPFTHLDGGSTATWRRLSQLGNDRCEVRQFRSRRPAGKGKRRRVPLSRQSSCRWAWQSWWEAPPIAWARHGQGQSGI